MGHPQDVSRYNSRCAFAAKDCLWNRQRNQNRGAVFRGTDGQISSELTNSLLHTPKTNTAARGRQSQALISRYSFAVISDFDMQIVLLLENLDRARSATGMAVNIGQALLYGSKDGHLDIGRKAFHVFWHIQSRSDLASLCEAVNIPAESGREANLVEQGRMKKMRKGADLGTKLID